LVGQGAGKGYFISQTGIASSHPDLNLWLIYSHLLILLLLNQQVNRVEFVSHLLVPIYIPARRSILNHSRQLKYVCYRYFANAYPDSFQ